MNQARLADLCTIQSGGTPRRGAGPYYGGTIPWAKIGDLETSDGVVRSTEESLTEEGLAAIRGRMFPPGTVLLAMYGSVGKTAVAGLAMSTNQAILGIQVMEPTVLSTEYLRRWLEHIQDRLVLDARGVTQQNISATLVRDLHIPLPPLAEQRRIAAVLDKADGIRRKRRESLRLLEEFLRSAFLEMFGDPVRNEKQWPTHKLGDLIESGPQNGLYRPAADYGSGTPIVRINSFYGGEITALGSLLRVRVSPEEALKYGLGAGDILVNRVNSREFLGKSALVPALKEPTVFESNMMRFSVRNNLVEPGYLVALFQTPYFKRQVAARTKDAVNQSSFNQDDLRAFEARIPPISFQRAYVTLQSLWVQTRQHYTEAATNSISLVDSLAQQAFQGL